jgi:transposase InsO family protein
MGYTLLRLVHSNIWGLIKVPSSRRAKYFVTFIDDYFGKVFCYFLKNKKIYFMKFQESKSFAKSQSGNKIKVLTNNGNEFTSFLTSHRIQHWFSTPYVPQLNEVVERMNGMIVEVVHSMFHHGWILVRYWAKVMNIAIYVQARCPHKAIHKCNLKKTMEWEEANSVTLQKFWNSYICTKTRANIWVKTWS